MDILPVPNATPDQNLPHRYSSPWSFSYRLKLLVWSSSWTLTCSWTPKPFNFFRIFVLRLFGAQIQHGAFVHQRSRIYNPSNLILHERACLGDRSNIYNIDFVVIHSGATVAQEAYLCTGTHDFKESTYPLITSPIVIGQDAFIGARAFLLPGVTIGVSSIVGACSVVTRSVSDGQTVVGNPARPLYN